MLCSEKNKQFWPLAEYALHNETLSKKSYAKSLRCPLHVFQVSEVQSWKTLPCSQRDSMTSRKMSRIVRTHPRTLCWRWSFPHQQWGPKEWLCPTNVSRPWQSSRDPPLSLDAKQTDGLKVDTPATKAGKTQLNAETLKEDVCWMFFPKWWKIPDCHIMSCCWGWQSNHHLKKKGPTWQNPSSSVFWIVSSDNPWKFWSNLEVTTQQLGYPGNVEGNHPNTEKARQKVVTPHIPSICERFSFIYEDPFLLEKNPNVEWSKGSRYLWQVGGSGGDIHSFVGFGTTEFPKLIPKKK